MQTISIIHQNEIFTYLYSNSIQQLKINEELRFPAKSAESMEIYRRGLCNTLHRDSLESLNSIIVYFDKPDLAVVLANNLILSGCQSVSVRNAGEVLTPLIKKAFSGKSSRSDIWDICGISYAVRDYQNDQISLQKTNLKASGKVTVSDFVALLEHRSMPTVLSPEQQIITLWTEAMQNIDVRLLKVYQAMNPGSNFSHQRLILTLCYAVALCKTPVEQRAVLKKKEDLKMQYLKCASHNSLLYHLYQKLEQKMNQLRNSSFKDYQNKEQIIAYLRDFVIIPELCHSKTADTLLNLIQKYQLDKIWMEWKQNGH